MYRIRLHGRGGQGIKTAAQILGSAMFIAGFETQDAPKYGAERRGAPILAGVRASRSRIDERGEITHPNLVLVADTTLFQVAAARVLAGVDTGTTLVIADALPEEVWRSRLRHTGALRVIAPSVDAQHPAVPLVGAAARLLGVIPRAALIDAIETELAWMDESNRARECARICAGFDAMSAYEGSVKASPEISAQAYAAPDWIRLELDGVERAAPDIRAVASSELNLTGAWRQQRPVINLERCNRCAWICSTLCPDSAIHVAADHAPVIDYLHCKGCMVCATVCPPHAIDIEPEPARAER